jgi:hypothetical protein
MKRIVYFISILLAYSVQSQQLPYNLTPDWESTPAGQFATGLGIADINNDGWKDLVVANGNDMARQHLVVYYNNGDGTFPLLPDWQSDDIDYHGHLSVGDIDQDGDLDVAVSVYIGPSGFSSPGKVKVYYNNSGELEGTPSFQSEPVYTFSCALGDADGDGDLDLAVACGEPYGQIFDNGRVFINNGGTFNTNADWLSSNEMGAMDVDFGDFDGNGYLDIIFSCEHTKNYLFLADSNGNISTQAAWQSEENSNFMNSLDIGFIGDNIHPGVVMTGNDQIGGDGRIRLYNFNSGIPSTSPASWNSAPVGYGSGILLADVTRNDTLDLIYGGWWLPMEILRGNGEYFKLIPSYTSNISSVVEAIQISDLRRRNIKIKADTINIQPDTSAMVYLKKQNIENIMSVKKNGVILNSIDYSHIPGKNWVAFTETLLSGDQLIIEYEYTYDGDIVISNWDNNIGNFIYYNTNTPAYIDNQEAGNDIECLSVYPVPATDYIRVQFTVTRNTPVSIILYDMLGNATSLMDVKEVKAGSYDQQVSLDIPSGTYVLVLRSSNDIMSVKILISTL